MDALAVWHRVEAENAGNSRLVTAETDQAKPLTAKHMSQICSLLGCVNDIIGDLRLPCCVSLSLVDVVFVVVCHGLLFLFVFVASCRGLQCVLVLVVIL